MASFVELLRYETLEARKNLWAQENGVDEHPYWLPFHFAYTDIFVGLQFQPLNLGWRQLQTVNDLVELCFQLSIVPWLVNNKQTDDPRGLTEELFGIPRDFHSSELDLHYSYRCSDAVGKVISFLPSQLPLELYSEADYHSLIEWYDFDYPDDMFVSLMEGFDLSIFGLYPVLFKRYRWKYNFTNLARESGMTRKGLVNRTMIEYFLRLINEQRESYQYTAESALMTYETYTAWEITWAPWLLKQLEWIMLFHLSAVLYIGMDHVDINTQCRSAEQTNFNERTRKLLHLYSLAPPLPASVVVSRGLWGVKFKNLPLNEVQVEHGFMSTSLVGVSGTIRNFETYLHLKVPALTPVIALLATNNRQKELLFAPGTRYILRSREKKGAFTIFHGEILL